MGQNLSEHRKKSDRNKIQSLQSEVLNAIKKFIKDKYNIELENVR